PPVPTVTATPDSGPPFASLTTPVTCPVAWAEACEAVNKPASRSKTKRFIDRISLKWIDEEGPAEVPVGENNRAEAERRYGQPEEWRSVRSGCRLKIVATGDFHPRRTRPICHADCGNQLPATRAINHRTSAPLLT